LTEVSSCRKPHSLYDEVALKTKWNTKGLNQRISQFYCSSQTQL
jgi:hypothetical protein